MNLKQGALLLFVVLCVAIFIDETRAQQNRFKSSSSNCCEDYCYQADSDKTQTRHFGTKTAYQIARSGDSHRQYFVPKCTATKFWMLSRHGTKLPDSRTINALRELEDLRDEVIANYEVRRSKPDSGAMCENDLELLRNWRWDTNITTERAEYLTVQGWNDIKFMAKHYKAIYSDIFSGSYSAEKFKFHRTSTQRTEASLKAFVDGLFGDNAWDWLPQFPTSNNDTLLKPNSMCPRWADQLKNVQDDSNSEYMKFVSSPLYRQTLSDISRRLGFNYDLPVQKVGDIYDACRYDQAWFLDRTSAWCTAFTKTQIEVLEYAEDLLDYTVHGYGGSINSNQACALVADMVNRLDSKADPPVTAYFAHNDIVQLFQTALGAFKDVTPMSASNYDQMKHRKWRNSVMGPFGSNVAAIRYDCPQEEESVKVMFFLNEKPINFDWCAVGLCSMWDVKEKYKRFTDGNCADLFCTVGSSQDRIAAQLMTSIIAPILMCLWRWLR